ncbi:Methionyl-tRNA formyltransferase [Hesseltinella vesiculosa]|uniref:Methionyl-tRNA formyltransferase, mitochondrial n=1 Tax=Hesseltinella vesiculosa TaxID=101127 RepID=A0A1X2GFT0_9FUNG|nr:Methionyl-tRNA formyltransferase [Hesseltinella vesiculosa]
MILWRWSPLTCRRSARSSTIRSFQRSQSTQQPFRILFFGTDNFATTHLQALIEEKNKPESCIASLELVSPPDRRTGRKLESITQSPTKSLAEVYSLPVHHTPAKATSLDDWPMPLAKDKQPFDLGVVVSFGYFIPPHIISAFRYGAINVHPSLLPKFRGAAPIQHTILKGERQTGVTVQELDDKEFDAGRILAQTTVHLANASAAPPTYDKLVQDMAGVGKHLLLDTLRHFDDRKKEAKVQDISKATKAPKIKKEWTEIDFSLLASWQIEQLHRAIGAQYPLRTNYSYVRVKKSGKELDKLVKLQLFNIFLPTNSPLYENRRNLDDPGRFVYHARSDSLHVMCADGKVVGIANLKAENKKVISARDFVNGYEILHHTGNFDVADENDPEAKKRQRMFDRLICPPRPSPRR